MTNLLNPEKIHTCSYCQQSHLLPYRRRFAWTVCLSRHFSYLQHFSCSSSRFNFIVLYTAHTLLAKICPECGSNNVAKILYGYIAFDSELEKDLEAGKIALGGCCVSGIDPKWECNKCGHRWGKLKTS